jgi:hypothetical protein
MARCEQGYLCEVCGKDVAEITDSDLYLRYILGEVPPEELHLRRERHLRCNPELAQYIVTEYPLLEVRERWQGHAEPGASATGRSTP